MGLERVPVHVAENLTAEQVEDVYQLMDRNRSHEEAFWDHDILKRVNCWTSADSTSTSNSPDLDLIRSDSILDADDPSPASWTKMKCHRSQRIRSAVRAIYGYWGHIGYCVVTLQFPPMSSG